MTKKNLIIVIILLAIIDLVAAGWYISRSIEATGRSQSLFDQRDSTDIIAEADTAVNLNQPDVFDKPQFNTFYFISNTPSISGDQTSYYTSTKHVKVIWPLKVNGDSVLGDLNKELIKTQASQYINIIDKIEELTDRLLTKRQCMILREEVVKLNDEIIQGRRDAIAEAGEYAPGNIVFKVLRRSGHIGKLKEIKAYLFDKINTI